MMKSVIKYPGAKWRIADWIISHMPEHHSYVEPYFGSGAVLFRKPASRIETINDLDDDVVNLFRLIRDNPAELAAAIAFTPYSRTEYESAFTLQTDNKIEKARIFLVKCWQGHGFRTNRYKSGWKNDVQGREAAYAMRNWYRLPAWVMETVERLKEIQIDCKPAINVIERFNYSNVLIYADPPYLLSTRSGTQYKHEMTDGDHIELLEKLIQHKGSVVLSGYDNDLYNDCLKGWDKHQINTTAEHGIARVETIWIKNNN